MKLYTLRFLHISSLERPSDIHNVLTNTNLQYHLTSPESKEQDTHSKEGKVDDHMTDDVYYQNIHSEQPIINVSFHPSPHLCDVDVTPLTRAIARDDLHTLHHDICKLVDRYCTTSRLFPSRSRCYVCQPKGPGPCPLLGWYIGYKGRFVEHTIFDYTHMPLLLLVQSVGDFHRGQG